MGIYLTILCCHCNMESVLINSDNHLEKKQAIDDDCGSARPHPQIQYLIERPGDFSGEENLFEKGEGYGNPFGVSIDGGSPIQIIIIIVSYHIMHPQ